MFVSQYSFDIVYIEQRVTLLWKTDEYLNFLGGEGGAWGEEL